MSESKVKASMNDIFEVLEQQKKLEKIKALITTSLEKVNQTINIITVENLTLTRSELDEDLKEPQEGHQPDEEVLPKFEIKNSHEVNSQILDIDVKPCFNEEIETDEDLDEL